MNEHPLVSVIIPTFNNKLRVNETKPVHQDYDLWKQFYDNGLKCKFMPIVTNHYRRDYSKLSKDDKYQTERNILLPKGFNAYESRKKYK